MFKKSMWIAFSMYSRVPVPRTEWSEKHMRYSMCFFPLVGALLGLLQYGLYLLADALALPGWCAGALMTGFLVIYTGGIHLDGFLDTQDAKHSWKGPEEKRRILKDPHVGGSAVISGVTYLMVYAALLGTIDSSGMAVVSLTYLLSRTLSGLSVVSFRKASEEGTVRMFADTASRRVFFVLLVELAAAVASLLFFGGLTGLGVLICAGIVFLYYRVFSYKQFGGINGDLAGYFLCLCELVTLAAAAILPRLPW